MSTLRIHPLVLAMTIASSAVAAQENNSTAEQEAALEEVVVTGYRASLQNSLNARRDSSGIVDAIYAEDIADFPDNNLAESLQRVAGVAISRSGGEGRQITVRGLGPSYTRVRINGMEAMASTGSTDAEGGNNRSRGFDFNTFSSDLFSQLIVRKTNSAEVEEGSLGATVDLKTARPMELDERVISVSGQLGYSDQSEKVDPQTSILLSQQFSDKFGALVAFSYGKREILDEGNSTVRWSASESFNAYTGSDPDKSLDEVEGTFHPRIPRYDSYTHEIERTGLALTLQYLPTEKTDVSLDVLYSKHDASRDEVFMQGVGNSESTVEGYNLADYEIQGNSLVYADIPNATLKAENRYDELSTEFTQTTLNVAHEFNDKMSINVLLGSAKSEHENPIQNTVIMQADGVGMSWDYRGDSASTKLIFGDGAYDPANWVMNGVRQRPQGTNNEFNNLAVDFNYEFNENLELVTGFTSKDFKFDSYQSRLSSEGANGIDIQTPGYIKEYDSGLGDGRPWLIPNRALIVSENNVLSNSGDYAVNPRQADTFAIEESTFGLFAQLNFNYELGDMPVSGDVGLRHFSTDQSSTGWFDADADGTDEQLWVDHSYDDILPAVNLKFEVLEDVVIRASASQGIARASLTQLKADQSVSVSGSLRSVRGGNPLLEPTKATSYDLGLELYMGDEAAMMFTVFKKEIDSHVQTLKDQRTLTELGIPASEAEAECNTGPDGYGADCNENLLWERSVPLNGPGGDLHGFEWNYQTTFGSLGGMFENIGFIANYTYVNAGLGYLNADGEVEAVANLLNLSEVTKSATLYYEDDRFSARIALVERSDYLTDAVGRNDNDQAGTFGTSNLDFSSSYAISDALKLSFEAINLTGEADDMWVDRNDYRVSYYHEAGTQFYLGAHYRF